MKILCLWPSHNKTEDSSLYNKEDAPSALASFTLVEQPESALIRAGQPFFVPDWDGNFEAEVMFVIRIDRLGRCIAPQFASRYYSEAALGVNFTAHDTLSELKAKAQSWDVAVGFDQSVAVGRFQQADKLSAIAPSPDTLHRGIAACSLRYTLKSGDLLMFSLGRKPRRVAQGDILTEMLDGAQLLTVRIR